MVGSDFSSLLVLLGVVSEMVWLEPLGEIAAARNILVRFDLGPARVCE